MKCIVLILPLQFILGVFVTVFTFTLSADTIELKNGERLDGVFRRAGAAGVVIDIAGQAITIPLERVQGIYFGTAKPTVASRVVPAPSLDAMDALRALRSVTESSVRFADYAPRVLDARIKVDKYLSISVEDTGNLHSAIALAMREYELASRAWDGSFPGHADLSFWKTVEANLDPIILKACPVIRKVVDRVQLAAAYQALGMRDTAMVDGKPAYALLWGCAADQVAEAEVLLAELGAPPKVEVPKASSNDLVPPKLRGHIVNQ